MKILHNTGTRYPQTEVRPRQIINVPIEWVRNPTAADTALGFAYVPDLAVKVVGKVQVVQGSHEDEREYGFCQCEGARFLVVTEFAEYWHAVERKLSK